MTEISEFERLAEEDGARFCQIRTTGLWGVSDREGMVIVPYMDGAMSKVEAARLYCEDKGLTASTPEAILARIVRQYRPYDTMDAFGEGFNAYQKDGCLRRQPYDDAVAGETASEACRRSVNGQAWDRGANAAMLYQRALAHLDVHPAGGGTPPAPGWLERLIRTGRC